MRGKVSCMEITRRKETSGPARVRDIVVDRVTGECMNSRNLVN